MDRKPRVSSLRWYAVYKNLFSGFKVISSLTTQSWQKFGKKHYANFIVYLMFNLPRLSIVHTYATRHDMTACDTTRFFAPHTIKWISSHICSTQCLVVTTKSCGNKNRSGSDFCRVSQRQYQENCYRKQFP